MTNVLGNC